MTSVRAIDVPETLQRSTEAPEKSARTDFLQLLVAQMRNQDPLQPQEGTEFIQQLATLTQVEQAATTNTNLEQIASLQAAANGMGHIGLVGHEVTAETSGFKVPTTDGTDLLARIPKGARDVTVEIKDKTGRVVRTIKLDTPEAGDVVLKTRDENNNPLADGEYTMTVKGTVGGKADTTIPTAIRGRVTELEIAGNGLKLFIGETVVSPTNIVSIGA